MSEKFLNTNPSRGLSTALSASASWHRAAISQRLLEKQLTLVSSSADVLPGNPKLPEQPERAGRQALQLQTDFLPVSDSHPLLFSHRQHLENTRQCNALMSSALLMASQCLGEVQVIIVFITVPDSHVLLAEDEDDLLQSS